MAALDKYPVLVVVGPTASGKTPLAVRLAEHLGGEIVNFDSVQVYRDFDLGAAKPSAKEMAQVPHHLYGVADAAEPWTAGEYARRARPVVEEIGRRGKLPVLTGGNGFYLQSLLLGLSPAPSDAALRTRLRQRTPEQVYRLLRRLDPEAGARIAAGDTAKAMRALEVRLLTGKPQHEVWRDAPAEPMAGVESCTLGLAPERAALYRRIEARAAQMFAGGIQEETRRQLQKYPAHLRIWESHGYKQACDIVLHGVDVKAALAEAQQEQRNYAKRQWTWFRRDKSVRWLAGFGDDERIQSAALAWAEAMVGRRQGAVGPRRAW